MEDEETGDVQGAINAFSIIVVLATLVISLLILAEGEAESPTDKKSITASTTKQSAPPVLTPLPHIQSAAATRAEELIPSQETDLMPPLDFDK